MPNTAPHSASPRRSAAAPRPHEWPSLDAPVLQGQALFRQILGCMAEPGTFAQMSVAPLPAGVALSPAAWAALLVLCDLETGVWIANALDRDGLAEAIAFHTGARIVERADQADFALIAPSTKTLPAFAEGSDTYPDRSTTLIVVVDTLEAPGEVSSSGHDRWRLSGPGILEHRVIALDASARVLMERLAANRASFPLGVDALVTSNERLTALPRSTRIEVQRPPLDTPTTALEEVPDVRSR